MSSVLQKPVRITRIFIPLVVLFAGLMLALTGPEVASAKVECGNENVGGLAASSNACKPIKKARIDKSTGKAIAPTHAPQRVKRVINWANRIRNKKYVYGGGHGTLQQMLNAKGYDCSGSISYALYGGKFLKGKYPNMPSGGFMNWQKPGKGKWITTYAHGGHAYMVVAGLRFDTSGASSRGGNRWTTDARPQRGFKVRHPANF